MGIVRLMSVIALFLCLTSCSDDIEVRSNDRDARLLSFYAPGLLFSTKVEPCLKALKVYDYEKGHTDVVLWELKAKEDCIEVREIYVGKPRKGFTDMTNGTLSGSIVRVEIKTGDGRFGTSSPVQL